MDRPALLTLDWRAVIAISGPDAVPFLQGLVSNDMTKASPERAVWTAFLTPQGKFLHEFMVIQVDDRLLLDCERDRRADLLRRLKLYRLRSKVAVEESDETVVALYGAGLQAVPDLALQPGQVRRVTGGALYGDPRLAQMGLRGVVDPSGLERLREHDFVPGSVDAWDAMRVAAGVPDGSRDLTLEKAILLENGFDELNGLDWDKGCYMGQELTARTRYRGLVRKRLMPMSFDGQSAPASGTDVTSDGKLVGTVHSVAGQQALALIKLEALEKGASPLMAGEVELRPSLPDWFKLPAVEPSSG